MRLMRAETVVISTDARKMRDDDYSIITMYLSLYDIHAAFPNVPKDNTHRPTVFYRDLSTHRCRSNTPPG